MKNREIYTVRRVPRHLKPITRGAGKGKQERNTGSVSLIMPDGTEYPIQRNGLKTAGDRGPDKGSVYAGCNDRAG